MKLLLRLFVTAVALWVTVRLVSGIEYEGHPAGLLAVALVFGVVNAVHEVGGAADAGGEDAECFDLAVAAREQRPLTSYSRVTS